MYYTRETMLLLIVPFLFIFLRFSKKPPAPFDNNLKKLNRIEYWYDSIEFKSVDSNRFAVTVSLDSHYFFSILDSGEQAGIE